MKIKSVYFLYIYLPIVWYFLKKKLTKKKTRSTPLKSRYNNQPQPEVTVDKMEPVKNSLSQMFIIGESVLS